MSKSQTEANKVVTEWVTEHTESLYKYALQRLSDHNLAQDLVQDTFIVAHQSFVKFENRSQPKTWLTSILKNKIMDHYRQVYRRNETFIEGNDSSFNENGSWKADKIPNDWGSSNLLDDPNFVEVFDNCIEALPERWGASIRIKYLNDTMDIEEIGVTKSNYWKMLERARTQLRNCIDNNWFQANK